MEHVKKHTHTHTQTYTHTKSGAKGLKRIPYSLSLSFESTTDLKLKNYVSKPDAASVFRC